MAKLKLRGGRYLTSPYTAPFAMEILEKLPYIEYLEASEWYLTIEGRIVQSCRDQGLRDYAQIQELVRLFRALLGCNDRFYLLTGLLGRIDAQDKWLFDRCREVEAEPDGHIDLWSRFHYKSTIITFAGAIQEVLCDPEIKIAIFSVVKPIAQAFLSQIKEELETNGPLKYLYADVLYENPKTLGSDGRPPKWGLARGITVKRKSNPKEATIEAHGLIDGQPTSRHFDLHIYDDVVTQDYLTEESIRKTTARWEMADNLGSHLGVRKWMPGTRYHYADTYGTVIERKSLIPRIYPATKDGTLDGEPVFLSKERWDQIKRDQRSTVSAQCLLNPIAGNEATFSSLWLKSYEIFPAIMNVYILVDPSKGTGQRSDRTAIAVVGIDQSNNYYLIDGYCHRMKLSERWEYVKQLKAKWERHPGVQMVDVGWERYGKDVELEVIETMQQRENNWFEIKELNTSRQGGHSKDDRIERLEPYFRYGRFYLPKMVYHPDFDGPWQQWVIFDERLKAQFESVGKKHNYNIGQIVYSDISALTKQQKNCEDTAQTMRIAYPIKRFDENKQVYDLTRVFIDEMLRHPFATHDDMIDATSRIYDITPLAPATYEAHSTEPLAVDAL
jgi:phage terminase large subunit-like protein